MVIIIFIL